MKKLVTVLYFILIQITIINNVFGQEEVQKLSIKLDSNLQTSDISKWNYNKLLQNKISRVVAFDYPNVDDTLLIKDSSLLFEKIIVSDSSIMREIKSSSITPSHSARYYEYRTSTSLYNEEGNLKKTICIVENKATQSLWNGKRWNSIKFSSEFKYDNRNREIRYVSKKFNCKNIYDNGNVITLLCDSVTTCFDYEYNQSNKKVKTFYSKICSNIAECDNYTPYHLRYEKEYDKKDNLIVTKSYDRHSVLLSKTIYLYNDNNKLIEKIDSSFCSITGSTNTGVANLTTYLYNKDKLVTKISEENNIISISKYDTRRYQIELYRYENNQLKHKIITPRQYEINEYEGGHIVSVISRLNKTLYKYDKENFLIEKSEYYNNRLSSLIKYFYEKF